MLWPRTGLAPWLGVLAFLLWVAKDAALYPFLKRGYEPVHRHGAEELVGREAVARSELAPSGQVRVGGEVWTAESEDGSSIPAQAIVRVTGSRGFTLRVRRDDAPPARSCVSR